MKNVLRILALLLITISFFIFSYQGRTKNASADVSRSTTKSEIKLIRINSYKTNLDEKLSSEHLMNCKTVTTKVTTEVVGEREVVGLEVSDLDITNKDLYSDEDIIILQQITEAECEGQSIEAKMNVASVILNRVNSSQFPDTIKNVVFQTEPSVQFSPIIDGRFWEVTITDETIQAIDNVLNDGVTNEALYFANVKDIESLSNQSWFSNLIFLFKDDSGHSFFTE